MITSLFGGRKVALEVENQTLRILVVKRGRITSWMSCPLSENLLQGTAAVSTAIQSALSSLLSGASVLSGEDRIRGWVSVSFPGSRSVFRTLTLPTLKSSKLMAEAVMREAERELVIDPEHMYLFWRRLEAGPAKQEVFVVGVQKDAYDRLYASLRVANIRPRLHELKPMALARAVRKPSAVIVDVERDNTDVIVVLDGIPRLVTSLPEPFQLATADIPEPAERIARGISRTVDYYATSQLGHPWDPDVPVVFTGELSGDPRLAQAVRSLTPYPVEAFVSPIPAPQGFPAATYAAAVGLAMKSGHEGAGKFGSKIDMDVYPQRLQRPQIPTPALATGFAILIGAVLLLPAQRVEAGRASALQEQEGQLSALRGQVAAAKSGLTIQKDVDQQISDLKATVASLNQERMSILAPGVGLSSDLNSIRALAPSSVSITRFSLKDSTFSLEGETGDYHAVLEYAHAVEAKGMYAGVTIVNLVQHEAEGGGEKTNFTIAINKRVLKDS